MFKVLVSVLVFCSFSALANESREMPRDPTRPLNYQPVAKAQALKLRLNSVLLSGKRRLAIINGQSLREGETLAGSKLVVKRIEANQVVLTGEGSTRTLTLVPLVVKKHLP